MFPRGADVGWPRIRLYCNLANALQNDPCLGAFVDSIGNGPRAYPFPSDSCLQCLKLYIPWPARKESRGRLENVAVQSPFWAGAFLSSQSFDMEPPADLQDTFQRSGLRSNCALDGCPASSHCKIYCRLRDAVSIGPDSGHHDKLI